MSAEGWAKIYGVREILNSSNVSQPRRKTIKFIGCAVSDDGVKTIVDATGEASYTDAAPLLGASTNQGAIDSLKRNLFIHLRAAVPAAAASNPYVNQTPLVITLPDNAKCQVVAGSGVPSTAAGGAWARAGTGTLGAVLGNASVGGSQYAVTPTGDFLFNATDAYTSVDVGYVPERQDIVSGTFSCTAGTGVVAGLPAGIISILEAEVLQGGLVQKMIVGFPASTAPASGNARLSLGKTGVFFAIADAATSVRLKLGVIPAINY